MFFGWLRFLVFLVGVMAVSDAGTQVYQHWAARDEGSFLVDVVVSFGRFLVPRLVIGVMVSALFLAVVVVLKQRPPWSRDRG